MFGLVMFFFVLLRKLWSCPAMLRWVQSVDAGFGLVSRVSSWSGPVWLGVVTFCLVPFGLAMYETETD